MARIVPTAIFVALSLLLAACAPPAQRSPTAGAPSPAAAEKKEAPAAKAGNPDAGRQLFLSQGCGACHTVQGVEGATGTVGPNLTGVAARAGQRVPGLAAEQYLRQSIQEPDAYTVEGFQKGVMPKLPLSDAQVNDLVAFLMTLR